MYGDWITEIIQAAGTVTGCTVVDVACNTGSFLYELMRRGAVRGVGYDSDSQCGTAIPVLNQLTGLPVEYHSVAYDSFRHEVYGAEPGDIVVAWAIMLHLSDPTYFLDFLGSITRRLLFLFTAVDRSAGFVVRYYPHPRVFTKGVPFPICFDGMTVISHSLLLFGLRELGFDHVYEIPYRRSWLPKRWYRDYIALVAVRNEPLKVHQ